MATGSREPQSRANSHLQGTTARSSPGKRSVARSSARRTHGLDRKSHRHRQFQEGSSTRPSSIFTTRVQPEASFFKPSQFQLDYCSLTTNENGKYQFKAIESKLMLSFGRKRTVVSIDWSRQFGRRVNDNGRQSVMLFGLFSCCFAENLEELLDRVHFLGRLVSHTQQTHTRASRHDHAWIGRPERENGGGSCHANF